MKNLFIIIFAISLIFLSSCNDKKKLDANLIGIVKLFAEDEIADASGVLVKIANTDFETTTDKDGNFELKNIPLGTYKITFSKEGYSSEIFEDYQIIGGGDFNRRFFANLYKKPTIKISSFSAENENNNLKCTAITEDTIKNVYFLFSTSSDVSDSLFMMQYTSWVNNNLTATINLSFNYLRRYMIFQAGDIIYITAYTGYCYLWSITDITFIYKKMEGLSYEHSEIKQVTVPSDFVSKYPDGYLPPISERDNNNM